MKLASPPPTKLLIVPANHHVTSTRRSESHVAATSVGKFAENLKNE